MLLSYIIRISFWSFSLPLLLTKVQIIIKSYLKCLMFFTVYIEFASLLCCYSSSCDVCWKLHNIICYETLEQNLGSKTHFYPWWHHWYLRLSLDHFLYKRWWKCQILCLFCYKFDWYWRINNDGDKLIFGKLLNHLFHNIDSSIMVK